MHVGEQAALGADVAGVHLYRVERRLEQRRQARVGLHVRVAVVTVEQRFALVEIRVLAQRGIAVEAFQGARETLPVDADLRGQRLYAVGLLVVAAQMLRHAAVGLCITGQQRAAGVFAAELGIEHHPAGNTGALPLGVVRVHRVDDVGIRRRLIDEALPGGVHHHAARQGAFDEQRTLFFLALHVGGRRPPAVFHQCGGRTQLLAGADAVAAVERRRGAPLRLRRLWMVLATHRLVALETAGGDHHAASRLHPQGAALVLQHGAGHPAVHLDQRLQRCLQP
ncbi:hypothetical protein D3C78_1147070 [compost metagenome]